jgi:hypothetical protein
MTSPKIPMVPEDLPQQLLFAVEELPSRPDGLEFQYLDFEAKHTLRGIPQKPTKKSIYLCQAEWAWSPMNNRIESFYIHEGPAHWLFWFGHFFDEDPGEWHWKYFPAFTCTKLNMSTEQVAVFMLMEYWRREVAYYDLDRYHWINGEGILSVSQIEAIAEIVWSNNDAEG